MLQDEPQEVCAWQCSGSGLAGAGFNAAEGHLAILLARISRSAITPRFLGVAAWRTIAIEPRALGNNRREWLCLLRSDPG